MVVTLGAVAVVAVLALIVMRFISEGALIEGVAFASRIAVLENRHALDAIGKARLFLHGRLMHGLRLIVATLAMARSARPAARARVDRAILAASPLVWFLRALM